MAEAPRPRDSEIESRVVEKVLDVPDYGLVRFRRIDITREGVPQLPEPRPGARGDELVRTVFAVEREDSRQMEAWATDRYMPDVDIAGGHIVGSWQWDEGRSRWKHVR